MIICLVDNTQHTDREALHKYLRRIKMKQSEYYTQYCPRFDLFSGEPIPFVNADQYLRTDFVNIYNIKKLIKTRPDEAKAWAIGWLKKRKDEKKLVYPPSHVELRSLMCPTVRYFNAVGGYQKICAGLGYKTRYEGELAFTPLPDDTVIIQDAREQKPLELSLPITVKKLNVGDYGIKGRNIFIERKSLKDFIGTITSKKGNPLDNRKVGVDRFRAELDRTRAAGAYLIMLVEESIGMALEFNLIPKLAFIKASPEHVFKNLRDLLVEYADVFQAVFVASRHEASQAIIKVFEAGDTAKICDLQFEYEEGRLLGPLKIGI